MSLAALVPRDLVANLKYRKRVLAITDPGEQEAIRAGVAEDILFYINTFVWQFNPLKVGAREQPIAPFISWDFQDESFLELAACIDEGEDALIEKSREMGASWIILILFHWRWLTRAYQKFLCISRNEDAVDKSDDPDSLFWKLDFINKHLPTWLLPKGYDAEDDRCRKKLVFRNPENGSTITGQASTGKAGVGGRATAIMVDEFSQIREDRQILSRTSDTSKCRIFNGTHMGPTTALAELARRPDIRKIRMHWTQHPDKVRGLYKSTSPVQILDTDFHFPADFVFVQDGTPKGGACPQVRSPWYDQQCKRKANLRDVAMDLDIDITGSVTQFYDALLIRDLQAAYCRDPVWTGEIDYDRESGKPRGLVPAANGRLHLWMRPRPDGTLPPSKYTAGSDPSAGTGATPSCFSAIDALKGEKVLEYKNPWLEPSEFATVAVALCWMLLDRDGQGAYLCWENAGGVGTKFGQTVLKLGYRNVWYSMPETIAFGAQQTQKPGWYPSVAARMVLHMDYRGALASRRLVNRSRSALEDTLGFSYDGRGDVHPPEARAVDDPSGAGQNHADIVTADALAWKLAMPTADKTAENREREKPVEFNSLAWRRQMAESNSEDAYWQQWGKE